MHSPRSKQETNCRIGERIRQRRIELGLTQKALGCALGMTWQQARKYETGECSFTAAHLYRLALFLRAPINDLFEELMADSASLPSETDRTDPRVNRLPSERECVEFLKAFWRIDRVTVRSKIADVARAVAVVGGEESSGTVPPVPKTAAPKASDVRPTGRSTSGREGR